MDVLHSMQNNNSSVEHCASSVEQPKPKRKMSMLDQFHTCIHEFIENIVDIKVDGNYGYHVIVATKHVYILIRPLCKFFQLMVTDQRP